MARRERSITRWNVAALVVFVLGGGGTVLLGQVALQAWARTGQRVPVGVERTVELGYGRQVVYYESRSFVPESNVRLTLRDQFDRKVPSRFPKDDQDFRLWLDGHSGRVLWEFEIVEPGPHSVVAYNANHASDEEVPPDDRIVFAKRPPTLDDVQLWRKVVQITGASLTFTITVVLYLFHGRALRVARATGPPDQAKTAATAAGSAPTSKASDTAPTPAPDAEGDRP